MKIDPYKHKEQYLNWKGKVKGGIDEVSTANSDIIIEYISDMENGLNVSSKSVKGPRSYVRLNNLRQRMISLANHLKQHCDFDLIDISEEYVIKFFNAMRNGTIKRKDGKPYQATVDFVKTFKAFWHWHMKVKRKQGVLIPDITEDLDTSRIKPKWVYLTDDQIKELCDNAKIQYKVLIMFIYDTGIRSPGELINLKVSDLYNDFKELNIRDEIVKTGSFGRRIKLMISSDLIRSHVSRNGLKGDDQLFDICHSNVNQYLKRLAKRILGEDISQAGEKYSNLTMYDFRHCSCCYWLPRYKSESALKYRFGWKKSDKIHYYSELLGMKDTISEEDMLIDLTKTEIEKRLLKTEQENEILKEKQNAYCNDVIQLKALMQVYIAKLDQLEKMQVVN